VADVMFELNEHSSRRYAVRFPRHRFAFSGTSAPARL
jgi:hypothetical protein